MPVRSIAVILAILFAACSAAGSVIVSNANFEWERSVAVPGANYVGTVWQDAAATDYTSAWFEFDGSSLAGVTRNLDEGSDYYLVRAGDVFGPESIAGGQFTPLFTPGPVVHPRVPIPPGEDFYLGIATAIWPDPYPQRTVFGWVQLRPGAELAMVSNAMSYDSPGIIVGTTDLAPEPLLIAPLLLLAVASSGGRTRLHGRG